MIDFILKFVQDNCFSLYFYFYNDISYDFFYASLLNIFFIFYFLFSLYLLNLITYVRHNFFTSRLIANFFRFSLSPKIASKEYRQVLKEGAFYFYNFLTLLELAIKSLFILSLGFLVFKFPFIDISSSPLLSWKFSNLFFKSRFYSYRPGFLDKHDASTAFNPLSVKTVQYTPKFPEIEVYQYIMGPKSMMRRRLRPDPYTIRKSWLVNSGKVFFDLTRKQGIGVSNYKQPKRYYLRWFRRPAWFRGYRRIAKEIFFTPSQKPETNVEVKPPHTYNLLSKGSLTNKRLSLKESVYDSFRYYRPEGVDRETQKNSFFHTLFFPGGRSKFLLFRSKDPTADIVPFENSAPTFKYPPMDYYFESKDNLDQELNEEEFPPAIDDPISFSRFVEFSNAVPGGLFFDKEGFRGIDRYRVFTDLRASEKENIRLHNKLATDHPSLATEVGYRGYIRMWRALQFSIDRVLNRELYTGKERRNALFRRKAAARFDFYYRFTMRNEPWPEDLHFLSDEFERPRLWPADYLEDPVIQVSVQRGDSDFERGIRSKKRWDFFYDPRGYANLAPRGILDIVTKKILNFLRSRAFFGNRKIVANDSLPTYNFGSSIAARLIPYSTHDVHHYALFRMNSLLGYQQGTFINQYRIKQDPLGNSFKQGLKRKDGLESPAISAKPSVSPLMEENALISKAYRQRIFVNKDLFRYMVYPAISNREGQFFEDTNKNLQFTGSSSMFGFAVSFLKGVTQFFLDQSFFLTTRLFAYVNALNKLPLYLYPVGGATNKGEALYLNYYSVKLRLLYFFRRFFRVLFNLKTKSFVTPNQYFGERQTLSNSTTEIDNFTFLAVKNSFVSTILSSGLLVLIFSFNVMSNVAARTIEFLLIHPGVFVMCAFLVVIGFWRRLYPLDPLYNLIAESPPYKSFDRLRVLLKKKSDTVLNFIKGVGFFNDIFVDGSFSRNTGEDSFNYQTRLSKALGLIFGGISKLERPLNNFFLKIGLKDVYDRTMIVAYSPPESKAKSSATLIGRVVPFSLQLRKGSVKGIFHNFRKQALTYFTKAKNKFNKGFLKVSKVWKKQKERLDQKTSNSIYKVRNWINR